MVLFSITNIFQIKRFDSISFTNVKFKQLWEKNLFQKLNLVHKWSNLNRNEEIDSESPINSFDFDSGCDELCTVGDDGYINFIRMYQTNSNISLSLSMLRLFKTYHGYYYEYVVPN